MEQKYIIIAVAVIAVVVLLVWQRKAVAAYLKKPETLEIIKRICCEVEEYYGNGNGKIKLQEACKKLHGYLPAFVKAFVTDEMLAEAVNYVFSQICVVIDGHKVPVYE